MSYLLRSGVLPLVFAVSACGLALDFTPEEDAGGGTLDASTGDGSVGDDGGLVVDGAMPVLCGNGDLDPGEECDDGNNTPADGCEPRSCTFSCSEHGDCDDTDNCTVDRCDLVRHTCLASTGPGCTTDACNMFIGCNDAAVCLYRLIDGDSDGFASALLGDCGNDCDDARSDIFPGAAEVCDGFDQDCNGNIDEGTGTYCGEDRDGDLFGSMTETLRVCDAMCPVGYVPNTRDCWDDSSGMDPGSPDAYPMQGAWFAAARADTSTWDWDCDGADELEIIRLDPGMTCSVGPGGMCVGGGWRASTPPACGVVAPFHYCDASGVGGSCVSTFDGRQQRCH